MSFSHYVILYNIYIQLKLHTLAISVNRTVLDFAETSDRQFIPRQVLAMPLMFLKQPFVKNRLVSSPTVTHF